MSDYRLMIRKFGGPDVIETEALDTENLEPLAPGQARIRHRAVGLNYIDTYRRSGLYPTDLPSGMGTEATGIVEALGADVTDIRVGDRVGYVSGPPGACSTLRDLDAEHLIRLPDTISDEVAAAGLLKGMTAAFLIEDCARVQAGQTVLVHAAAGGVGRILVQWLSHLGVRVIAHAGTEAKADIARSDGAETALSLPMEALAKAVRDITAGRGVDVVFDGVGADSWVASLASLARRGLLVTYGNASGPVAPFDPLALMRAGSVFVTRPTLYDYATTATERRRLAQRLFDQISSHAVKIAIGQRFDLHETAKAHIALEGRATTGSTVLLVPTRTK